MAAVRQGDVLEPHTDYRLKVVTHISASGIASKDIDVTEFAYFRTEGLRPRALSTPVGQDAATFDSGLDDLARYVAHTVPSTFPRGESRRCPASLRAYDVGVAFNENYVDLMYRSPGAISGYTCMTTTIGRCATSAAASSSSAIAGV
jgi:hypothetical protein